MGDFPCIARHHKRQPSPAGVFHFWRRLFHHSDSRIRIGISAHPNGSSRNTLQTASAQSQIRYRFSLSLWSDFLPIEGQQGPLRLSGWPRYGPEPSRRQNVPEGAPEPPQVRTGRACQIEDLSQLRASRSGRVDHSVTSWSATAILIAGGINPLVRTGAAQEASPIVSAARILRAQVRPSDRPRLSA